MCGCGINDLKNRSQRSEVRGQKSEVGKPKNKALRMWLLHWVACVLNLGP